MQVSQGGTRAIISAGFPLLRTREKKKSVLKSHSLTEILGPSLEIHHYKYLSLLDNLSLES